MCARRSPRWNNILFIPQFFVSCSSGRLYHTFLFMCRVHRSRCDKFRRSHTVVKGRHRRVGTAVSYPTRYHDSEIYVQRCRNMSQRRSAFLSSYPQYVLWSDIHFNFLWLRSCFVHRRVL
ncbi:hypothetical protein, unlikely [Trypanosoma brucei gambiense DAL972]|uniref:Uncharacterized protein n=1 Tax=Trypanosoma brucei gambiense (strain MHOM/CI/86/DAL972) TaxID=679716 RepID=C9ZNA7_TRYB9|nr:hypothetical protein, unlikely [Trypanosoma brucei gambiense DAL972]CBH10885.1 hypothetical protein, unlikely [Trypanosoma brucei gambiense DAL972]|eukprot:XP_011773172.1 hypothetical protein, unlikely [Trypanosoma brucei gambiense DAL972]